MTSPQNRSHPLPRHQAPEAANAPAVDETKAHWLSNSVYDALHLLAMVLLPAAGTLYFALSGIWNLPDAEQVIGTITAVDAFLGGLLKVSKAQYNSSGDAYDGNISIGYAPSGKKVYSLNLNSSPEDLDGKDSVTFKISS